MGRPENEKYPVNINIGGPFQDDTSYIPESSTGIKKHLIWN